MEKLVVRSPEEIAARIQKIQDKMEDYYVYTFRGDARVLEPSCERALKVLRAKVETLKWVLGGLDSELYP